MLLLTSDQFPVFFTKLLQFSKRDIFRTHILASSLRPRPLEPLTSASTLASICLTFLTHPTSRGKGKADDLYRGSMQSEDHRRTALQYPLFIGPYAAANSTALLA